MKTFFEVMGNMPIPIVYINSRRDDLSVPYGIYRRESASGIGADNRNFVDFESYSIEVYFSDLSKQIENEVVIEKLLKENDFYFKKSPDIQIDKYITMTSYDVERIKN